MSNVLAETCPAENSIAAQQNPESCSSVSEKQLSLICMNIDNVICTETQTQRF